MVTWSCRKPKSVAAVIFGSYVFLSLFDEPQLQSYFPSFTGPEQSQTTQLLRRVLLEVEEGEDGKDGEDNEEFENDENDENGENGENGENDENGEDDQQPDNATSIYSWARENIRPLSTTPQPSKETILFWHIPKSGGSTAKAFFRCLRKTITVESQPKDILRAEEIGLIPSGQVDVVFSSYPDFAVEHLFDRYHKTRVLAMFRHPVERLISKFYYLQVATWENTYRPEWKDMDILDWAKSHNIDNNHMVKKLAGKVQRKRATNKDYRLAKSTIETRFVVGLMHEMEESMNRFNTVMGINGDTDKSHDKCMGKYFGKETKKRNSNAHPKVEKGSPAWELLAEQNLLDIQLYENVLEMFEEQKELIDSYASRIDTSAASSSASRRHPVSSGAGDLPSVASRA